MNSVSISSIAGLSLSLLLSSCNNDIKQEKQVNFIVIYLDDMGYGDLTMTGAAGYKTPNIDRMASQGVFFSRYYAPQAVCTASRAGLLTGCYPNRVGLSGALGPNSPVGIADEEVTIAEVLKQKGYSGGFKRMKELILKKFEEASGEQFSNDRMMLSN